MRLPKNISILGVQVIIKEVVNLRDKEGIDIDGQYSPNLLLIEIDSKLQGKEQEHTFLHEYGHALWDILGMANCSIPWQVEELIVDNLGKTLSDNFRLVNRL